MNEKGHEIESFDITCWYISFRRVYEALHAADLDASTAVPIQYEPWIRPVRAKEATLRLIGAAQPQTLTELLVHGQARPGQFFIHYGPFRFNWPRRRGHAETATASARLDWLTPPVTLRFELSATDLTASSSRGQLSGLKRQFLLAVVQEVTSTDVLAIPYVLGTPVEDLGSFGSRASWQTYNEIYVDEIDSFSRVRDVKRPAWDQVVALRDIPEKAVKQAFQEIIGEPFAEKDWGGEHADLDSSHLIWRGRRVATMFAFKGPAIFRMLHPGKMGKNGDQIDRLFHHSADLYVVQHCHKFAPTVRNMMRTYAASLNTRHFAMIDGADTYRILRAYNKCGLRSPRRRGLSSA